MRRRGIASAVAGVAVLLALVALRPSSRVPEAPRAAVGGGVRPPAGRVGVPVRVADAGAVGLLHAGDRIDLYATGQDPLSDEAGHAVARDVPVLAVPAAGADPGDTGALIVVSLPRAEAGALSTSTRFSLVILGNADE